MAAPVIRAITQRLESDAELMAMAPGGVHFGRAPADTVLPCILIGLPTPPVMVGQFRGTAFEDCTVLIVAADDGGSAVEAQAIADRIEALLTDQPLPFDPPWQWMATYPITSNPAEVPEADLTYQQRGGSYRIKVCR